MSPLLPAGANLPYAGCIAFTRKFVDYIDYIVWKTKTTPEGQFYNANWNDLAYTNAKLDVLHRRRHLIDGMDFAVVEGVNWDQLNPSAGHGMARNGNGKGGPQGTCQLEDLPTTADALLFPSYNPLNAGSFTYFRQVPVFLLGLIDIPFLNPDGNRASPANFFNHDGFHIRWSSNRGRRYRFGVQQWGTLFRRLQALTGEAAPGVPDEERALWGREDHTPAKYQNNRLAVYADWDRNARRLNSIVSRMDPPNREAVEIMLFMLYHEPTTNLNRPPYNWCTVVEVSP